MSALAIRIFFALIARAALRIYIIIVSTLRSPKSVKERYQGVMCIWNNHYVDMCSLNISPTGRACKLLSFDFCSGNKKFVLLPELLWDLHWKSARGASVSALAIRILSPLLPEQLCGFIFSQFPRYDHLNRSKNDTKTSCVSETITMSTYVR